MLYTQVKVISDFSGYFQLLEMQVAGCRQNYFLCFSLVASVTLAHRSVFRVCEMPLFSGEFLFTPATYRRSVQVLKMKNLFLLFIFFCTAQTQSIHTYIQYILPDLD